MVVITVPYLLEWTCREEDEGDGDGHDSDGSSCY